VNITKKKSKKSILKILSEPSTLKILNYTKDIPVSVQEIINNTGLPYSTTYKKIRWMLKNDMLFLHKMKLSKEGKKFALFKSKISRMAVVYDNGEVTVSITEN